MRSKFEEFVIFGKHEIPAVKAIFAAVGNDVAGQPARSFLSRVSEKKRSATAVDAVDLWVGLVRLLSRTHNSEYGRFEHVA